MSNVLIAILAFLGVVFIGACFVEFGKPRNTMNHQPRNNK